LRDAQTVFAEDSSRKQEWEVRKTSYIADKVYNAHSILGDYRDLGPALWSRFKRGRDKQLWYFTELAKVYAKKDLGRLPAELKRTVDELAMLSAAQS
jgi:hypothetical protein